MISKSPGTNINSLRHQSDALSMYPNKVLILNFDDVSTTTTSLTPLPNRFGNDDYVVWINNVVYEGLYTGTKTTLNLSTTGINGLIDGITFTAANARDFLIWGLANNQNNGFLGFALTHKPYSASTGPGTVAKGASVAITGMTNAYQFTVGSRVQLYNSTGASAQLYEYNWGTVTAINSSTSIQVLMDNNANYGRAFTTAPLVVKQWDKFRPWVVTSSAQSLYSNNYRLLGELTTDTSGNITTINKVSDEWRIIPFIVNFTTTTANLNAISPFNIEIGRYIPLWTDQIRMLSVAVGSVSTSYEVGAIVNNGRGGGFQHSIQVTSIANRENKDVSINKYAKARYASTDTSSTSWTTYVDGYRVDGGMRE